MIAVVIAPRDVTTDTGDGAAKQTVVLNALTASVIMQMDIVH